MDRDVGVQHVRPPSATTPVPRTHRYAIVVGIDRYPGFSDLRGACNDAAAFAQWLIDPLGGDVPEENLRLHLGREAADARSARPTKTDVDNDLHDFVVALKRDRAPARLYVYFAGHGVAAGWGTGAVLMADARPGLCSNLSLAPYREWLERCRDFSEVVLISDCCRTVATEVPEGMPPHDTCEEPYGLPHAAFVALATDLGDRAFESRDARGQFTTVLLDGLRGAAADPGTGVVRSDLLGQFLSATLVERANPPQTAQTVHIGTPLTFGRVVPQRFDVAIQVGSGPVRPVHIVGNADQVVATERRPSGPWHVQLGRGLYEFVDPATAPVLFKVDGPGTRVGA